MSPPEAVQSYQHPFIAAHSMSEWQATTLAAVPEGLTFRSWSLSTRKVKY